MSDALKSGRASNANGGTKSSVRHRSVQAIIIGRKGPKFLKSLSGNLGDFSPSKGTREAKVPSPNDQSALISKCEPF
jgi:hypothetical protein